MLIVAIFITGTMCLLTMLSIYMVSVIRDLFRKETK